MKTIKKYFALFLALVLCFGVLAACGSSSTAGDGADETGSIAEAAASEETETTEEETTEAEEETYDDLDFDNWTEIVTTGVFDEDVTFSVLPNGYNNYETEHEGTVIKIYYTTDVYGETYEKFATVYLPYGYDENDTETKYNVIYFQHGSSGSPNELWDHDMKSVHAWNLINNIFDPDHQVMEPCIIVCPTYYLEYDEEAYVTPGDNPAGDGRYEGIDGNYYLEVVQDLIPAVESQLNVYCEDFTEEGIAATRDHRAWAGYSRGAVCTWYMFNHDLEYFAYWIPMSCEAMAEGADGETFTNEEAYEYLLESIEAHPDLDFFIYATTGGEGDNETIVEQVAYLAAQTDTFSFGTDPEENNLYLCRSDFMHNDLYFPYTLANAASVLWK